MEIRINQEDNLIEYWLTKSESADASLQKTIRPEFATWKKKGYMPVIFTSGTEDLQDSIEGPRHNGELIAKNTQEQS